MRIAAYCRVSTDRDEQLNSLQNQKKFFEEYAERHGHKLVKLYADEGISGTSLKKRDAFNRLLQDAKLGLFEMVVVKDVSRLARNTVDFLQSIRTLKSYGVNTLFITANMDSLGESEFVLTLFGAMAQEESANLSKRIKFGKKINAEKGHVPHSIFGYDYVDNFTLAINEKEAQIIREIYRLYVEEDMGDRAICFWLNEKGITTKNGCQWSPSAVRRILVNSLYCGQLITNKSEVVDYLTGKTIEIPQDQQFHHNKPEFAILSPETFNRAQQIRAYRNAVHYPKEFGQKTRYSSKHLFSCLIKCAECGNSYHRKKRVSSVTGQVQFFWACRQHDQLGSTYCSNKIAVKEPVLIAQLNGYLTSLLTDKDLFIHDILNDVQKRQTKHPNTLDQTSISTKRNRLLEKKERYQEMYVNDVITMTELKEKMNEIAQQLEALDYSLKQYEKSLEMQYCKQRAAETYRQEIERFLQLDIATNVDLRRILNYISVSKDGKITFVLKKIEDINNT